MNNDIKFFNMEWRTPYPITDFEDRFGTQFFFSFFLDSNIYAYRNWPQYGLCWSGLCCHCGTAWVGSAAARPLVVAAAGLHHKCCAAVAAPTTPAQTVWVVNLYSTTKTKQSLYCEKRSNDEPLGWNVPGWQRHCDESVHRNSIN